MKALICLSASLATFCVRPVCADWTFTSVPNQAVHHGDYARMLVDRQGSLHFVLSTFYYASTGDINYHTRMGSTWSRESLWGEYGGINVSPVIDSEGKFAFLHNRGWVDAGYFLRLAKRDAGIWTFAPVAPAGEWPASCSLAVDVQGNFHAAYAETDNGDLIYSRMDVGSGSWSVHVVDGDVAGGVDLGVSPSGIVRITYLDTSGNLTIASGTGSSWSHQTVHSAAFVTEIAAHSSVVDSAGQVHVAFCVRTGTQPFVLRYAHQVGDSLVNQVVPFSPSFGGVSLALDAFDRPGIAYGTSGPAQSTNVGYIKFNGVAWTHQPVTSDGASRLVGLVFQPDGVPVIAIQRSSFNTVMVASPSCESMCPVDVNCDATVDFFDYLDFVDAFSSNQTVADFNGDGVVDFFDYLDFVDAFSTGC